MSLHTPDTLEIFVELTKLFKAVVGVTCILNSVSSVMEFLQRRNKIISIFGTKIIKLNGNN